MQVTTEELERCEVLLTATIEHKKIDKLLKKAAKKLSSQYRMPGFRPGKVPYQVVVRQFGPEAIQKQLFEDDGEKLIRQALDEADVTPYGQVGLEDVTLDPFTLKLRVPTEPKIVLKNYRETEIEIEPIEPVSDEDIDNVLERIQDQHATWVPVERAAAYGDVVSMLVTQKDGDKTLVEAESLDFPLTSPSESEPSAEDEAPEEEDEDTSVDENVLIQRQFAENILNVVSGDEKVFSINYSEAYSDSKFAGKTITFIVEVSAVKEKEVDPLDDEFAQAIGNKESMAEWRNQIAEDLKKNREHHRDQILGGDFLQTIVESAEALEWPLMIENEMIDNELSRQEGELRRSNLTLDAFYNMQGVSEEEWREKVRADMSEQLARGLVVNKLAELEEVSISQEEVFARIQSLAQYMGQGNEFLEYALKSERVQHELANEILTEKVLLRLAAIAKGETDSTSAASDKADETTSTANPDADEAVTETESVEESPTEPTTDA